MNRVREPQGSCTLHFVVCSRFATLSIERVLEDLQCPRMVPRNEPYAKKFRTSLSFIGRMWSGSKFKTLVAPNIYRVFLFIPTFFFTIEGMVTVNMDCYLVR